MQALPLPELNHCTVAVIGLGYVGLPLAVAFARPATCLRTGVAQLGLQLGSAYALRQRQGDDTGARAGNVSGQYIWPVGQQKSEQIARPQALLQKRIGQLMGPRLQLTEAERPVLVDQRQGMVWCCKGRQQRLLQQVQVGAHRTFRCCGALARANAACCAPRPACSRTASGRRP